MAAGNSTVATKQNKKTSVRGLLGSFDGCQNRTSSTTVVGTLRQKVPCGFRFVVLQKSALHLPQKVRNLSVSGELTSLSSSSRVNSFFLTTLSWLRKLNSAAFFCSLANLFSYLETFFSVGLTLRGIEINGLEPGYTGTKAHGENLQFTAKVVDLGVQVGNLVGGGSPGEMAG